MQKDLNEIAALENQALDATRRGDAQRAVRLWETILARAPDHPRALRSLSHAAFEAGRMDQARALLRRLVEVDGHDKQQWLNLAAVCLALQDEEGEEAALRGALTIDPYDLVALVLRARQYRRQGKRQAAASACSAVAAVAPPMHVLPPELKPAVSECLAWHDAYNREFGDFLDQYLAPHFSEMDGENLRRFRESLDIMTGRKRRYDSQSAMFHFQGLAPTTFFERKDFPWMAALEAQTGAIRDEFLAVLGAEEGFTPYINYAEDQPLEQWAELNKSLSWSAFRLIEAGERIEENASRCPVTMAALRATPQPVQPGRTPSAMYSVLKPKTRIPPHTGVSNVRLVAHLPLIVPPGCGFRVGNDVREWTPGQGFVFDDTIEHEAWNDSDQLRVVLIFDVWHPHLSEAERAMITAMSAGISQFTQTAGGFGL